uniref:Integrin-alpha FG-GAP repeat-containing protein 2 n=1 Tax=Phallusia mammillata TaxID=59560 RepID=A0A6F9DFD4_9ASCI|nr:integrin-alpha FG-GAP repeat-containing protein 2 [Phallusia mammillata]
MRSVSFVQHLRLTTEGKVSHRCLALGDVDGDEFNELVVGDSKGTLSVYKGDSLQPWQTLNDLGDISCICIGDILNTGKPMVTIITVGGNCTVIDFGKSFTDGSSQVAANEQLVINVNNMFIGDVDGDGKQELVTSHSDQHVSAFRWNDRLKKFSLLQRWKLKHLLGNVSLHVGTNNEKPTIMVSQPGCQFSLLHVGWRTSTGDSPTSGGYCNDDKLVQATPLSSQRRSQNPAISCQIIGNIRKTNKSEEGYFAMCTGDGTIKLIEENHILWSLQVDHQLFALEKVDILGDKREEVIVCARDGQTYIVDHDRNVVRYHFHDDVQAFCAGNFSIDGKENIPCMVYADFHKQLWVYYDVRLPYLRAADFITLANEDPEMVEIFEKFEIKTDEEKRKFLNQCLNDEITNHGELAKTENKSQHSKEDM